MGEPVKPSRRDFFKRTAGVVAAVAVLVVTGVVKSDQSRIAQVRNTTCSGAYFPRIILEGKS